MRKQTKLTRWQLRKTAKDFVLRNPAEHLGLLQDKINAYISYIENRQYEESFGGKIKDFQIVIRFAEKAPEQCEKFIAVANKQLKKAKVKIVF